MRHSAVAAWSVLSGGAAAAQASTAGLGRSDDTLAQALHLGATAAVLAFFLVTVVLNTAVSSRSTVFAPLAIGMTLTLNIIMGGALTGAVFNPARALGPMIATGNLNDAWLYVVAPIVGASSQPSSISASPGS